METTISLKLGQVVRSKMGRDKDEIFVILEIVDDTYLYIVNGNSRKLSNPKKKKVKHLYIYNSYIDLEVDNFNDSYLRKQLAKYY